METDEGTIRVRVAGARMPARIYLYVDGDLADMWVDVEASYELQAGRFTPGPHAITARAVDALGRWGGASTVVDVESDVESHDLRPPAPRRLERPEPDAR